MHKNAQKSTFLHGFLSCLWFQIEYDWIVDYLDYFSLLKTICQLVCEEILIGIRLDKKEKYSHYKLLWRTMQFNNNRIATIIKSLSVTMI